MGSIYKKNFIEVILSIKRFLHKIHHSRFIQSGSSSITAAIRIKVGLI